MEIETRVFAVIEAVAGTRPANIWAHFEDDLELDSFAVATVFVMLEDEFGIRFAEEDCAAASTVHDAVALVEQYTEETEE